MRPDRTVRQRCVFDGIEDGAARCVYVDRCWQKLPPEQLINGIVRFCIAMNISLDAVNERHAAAAAEALKTTRYTRRQNDTYRRTVAASYN